MFLKREVDTEDSLEIDEQETVGSPGKKGVSKLATGSSSTDHRKPAAFAPVALYKLDTAILENIFSFLLPYQVLNVALLCTEAWKRSLMEWVTIVDGDFGNPVGLIENLHRLPRLRSLDLMGNEIDVAGARALAIVLNQGHCSNLKTLNLSQNNLGETGVLELFACAGSPGSQNLTELDLSHNFMGPRGFSMVTRVLAMGHLPALARLDLSCNATAEAFASGGYESPRYLHFYRLQHLRLFANELGPQEAIQMAAALRQVSEMRLESLDISWNHIGDDGVRHLLLSLHSRGTQNTMKSLNLCHNGITDCEPMGGPRSDLAGALPFLVELNLAENAIGDRWARALSIAIHTGTWEKLMTMDLSANSITNTGAIMLKEAISVGKTGKLKTLMLQGNNNVDQETVASVTVILE